jgi:hypothetical protein
VGIVARNANVIVLCEDRAHWNFVTHYLKKSGFNHRQLRPAMPPRGKGSAADFVLRSFVDQVRAFRARASYQSSTALVTVIDADVREVEERLRELDQRLRSENLAIRGDIELICLLVPKRNVQTWICYLNEAEVDEFDDYKNHAAASEVKQAAFRLRELLTEDPPSDAPSSLRRAWPEFRERLPSG